MSDFVCSIIKTRAFQQLLIGVSVWIVPSIAASQSESPRPRLKFHVSIAAELVGAKPESGRVLVGIGPKNGQPNFTNYHPPVLPILGLDAEKFSADSIVIVDASATVFPDSGLEKLSAGEYTVQAVFATNRDINLPFAPGNAYCEPIKLKLDPKSDSTVRLVLDRRSALPNDSPKDDTTHKFHSIPSKLLSDFHGRPMFYRVAVVLPSDFAQEPDKKYGLVVQIGGFGTRYSMASRIQPDSRFIQILPDGAGPYGDPYQVDSANNGPYGQAFTTEVIPFIEKTYRCFGTPKTRFTTGGSTGGWVSLALQLFYPDFFNGCWSQCPDSVTFEKFELVDLYGEPNAFINTFGVERPSTRTIDGDTISTVRHEVQLEKVLGRGGKWTLSGRDWASWNAVYGPRGPDGLPVPMWDGDHGEINKSVLEHWKKYDLKLLLENKWREIGPKLAGGKVNVWVGDSDDYFLNAAVRRFKDSTDRLENPKFDGTILIEARKGHEGGGWSRQQILDAMAARME